MSPVTTLRITKDSPIAISLALLATIVISSAVAYSRLTAIERMVAQHGAEITALQAEARNTRDILIRIDENVKELKELRRTLGRGGAGP